MVAKLRRKQRNEGQQDQARTWQGVAQGGSHWRLNVQQGEFDSIYMYNAPRIDCEG